MNIPERIDQVKLWYHSIDLKGHVTPGMVPPEEQERKGSAIPEDLNGMTVLDIGAWDGYYSFLAEQRGAKRVVALDSFPFRQEEGYGEQSINGFLLAKEILESKVEYLVLDVHELHRLEEEFDVVFMFEVHHHLWDPILALDLVCQKCKKLLLIEGDVLGTSHPIMVSDFDPKDRTKAWRISKGLLGQMLGQRGFSAITEAYCYKTSIYAVGDVSPISGMLLAYPTERVFWRCWRQER